MRTFLIFKALVWSGKFIKRETPSNRLCCQFVLLKSMLKFWQMASTCFSSDVEILFPLFLIFKYAYSIFLAIMNSIGLIYVAFIASVVPVF